MGFDKVKLRDLIELCDETNADEKYSVDFVRGISTSKKFIETKANMDGVPLKGYKIVRPGCFAYVPDTSRRGDKISLAFNDTTEILMVSSISVVFKVRSKKLSSYYLFMYFNRPEFDRYSRYNSYGSAREPFNWSDMCDIEIDLPDLKTQEKFVKVYLSMVENQKAYERGLKDLKTSCVASIESLRKKYESKSILPFIEERTEINANLQYKDLVGVGNEGFIEPRGARTEDTFAKCNIFYPKDFVYNPSVISKGAIALNLKFQEPKICTEEYIVFHVKDDHQLLPEYLFLWLRREDTGRYLEYYFMDSVRNRVYFENLEAIQIPIPSIEVQEAVAKLYRAYEMRREINERLKGLVQIFCPILIKGSIEEAGMQ